MTGPASRLDVATADGTALAVWVAGDGPPIVLVHGSMCDHTTFDALIAELRSDFTVHAIDRRGFGASEDSGRYAAEREFADVASVVDRVAGDSGRPVTLFGHSWGASCAMGAAVRSPNVARLVLYEPSFGLKYPPGFIGRVETQVAAGDAAGAMISVLVDLVGMTAAQVDELKSSPSWPDRLATAPTIAREARIEDGWDLQRDRFDAISAPTLFITGSESPPDLAAITGKLASQVPGARVQTLSGHGHFAYKTDASLVAGAIRDFVGAES